MIATAEGEEQCQAGCEQRQWSLPEAKREHQADREITRHEKQDEKHGDSHDSSDARVPQTNVLILISALILFSGLILAGGLIILISVLILIAFIAAVTLASTVTATQTHSDDQPQCGAADDQTGCEARVGQHDVTSGQRQKLLLLDEVLLKVGKLLLILIQCQLILITCGRLLFRQPLCARSVQLRTLPADGDSFITWLEVRGA
eukprot:4284025-Prymnesium_polylepis.1